VTLTSCRRAATMVCPGPAPLLPRGSRSALCRRVDGTVAAVSHGQHVPRPPLQSGLVALTFDLLTLKVVSKSRMTWATSCQFWSS